MEAVWTLPEKEVEFRFMSSGGPGGQHANRSNTKVEAVFRPGESLTIPDYIRDKVIEKLGPSVRVTVDDHRSQLRNRELAMERLQGRIDAACRVDRPRRDTKPTRASGRRRLESKRRRGDVKRGRRRPSADD